MRRYLIISVVCLVVGLVGALPFYGGLEVGWRESPPYSFAEDGGSDWLLARFVVENNSLFGADEIQFSTRHFDGNKWLDSIRFALHRDRPLEPGHSHGFGVNMSTRAAPEKYMVGERLAQHLKEVNPDPMDIAPDIHLHPMKIEVTTRWTVFGFIRRSSKRVLEL